MLVISNLADGRKLHSREEWAQTRHSVGVPDSRDLAVVDEFTVKRAVGIKFGDEDPAQWLRNIYDWHVHEFCYDDIAFHFAIDKAGDIWECRSLDLWSADTPDHNEKAISATVLRGLGLLPDEVRTGIDLLHALVSSRVEKAGGGVVALIEKHLEER